MKKVIDYTRNAAGMYERLLMRSPFYRSPDFKPMKLARK
jgi:hypothetical protein